MNRLPEPYRFRLDMVSWGPTEEQHGGRHAGEGFKAFRRVKPYVDQWNHVTVQDGNGQLRPT